MMSYFRTIVCVLPFGSFLSALFFYLSPIVVSFSYQHLVRPLFLLPTAATVVVAVVVATIVTMVALYIFGHYIYLDA